MTLTFERTRIPEFPAEHEFNTVIVGNLDPRPIDAPAEPGPVKQLANVLRAGGWEVRIGFSRAYRRGMRTGTYRVAEFFGVFAGMHETAPYRVVAVYWRFADKTEEHSWFRDTGSLELTEKPCDTPGGWTWEDPRIVQGFNRHRMKITDVKEFAKVRGSVVPGWFAGIARRFAEQAAKQLCGAAEEHPAHTWDTVNGAVKSCSGRATKPKETEAS